MRSGRWHAPSEQMEVKYSEEPMSPRLLFLTVTGQNSQPWAAGTPQLTGVKLFVIQETLNAQTRYLQTSPE